MTGVRTVGCGAAEASAKQEQLQNATFPQLIGGSERIQKRAGGRFGGLNSCDLLPIPSETLVEDQLQLYYDNLAASEAASNAMRAEEQRAQQSGERSLQRQRRRRRARFDEDGVAVA